MTMRLIMTVLLLALAAPLAIDAQDSGRVARLGILLTGAPSEPMIGIDDFLQSLRALGWVEGKNLTIERRWAGTPDRLPDRAAELIRLKVDVILAPGPPAVRAAKDATSTIPIVMIATVDLPKLGVASLARPGGNLTGLTIGQPDVISEKQLELLKQALPRLSRVLLLWDVPKGVDNPEGPSRLVAAAQVLGLRLSHAEVNSPADFDRGFKIAKEENAGAVLVFEGPRAVANAGRIAELGLKNRLPIMSFFRPIVAAGGLMSYGVELTDLFRRAAVYVNKILKGTPPGELSIEEPIKYELVINANTAKRLSLTIPPSLLVLADQVIE
jgi:putative tryptophan/tyrosine transport system substrate-binding protein